MKLLLILITSILFGNIFIIAKPLKVEILQPIIIEINPLEESISENNIF